MIVSSNIGIHICRLVGTILAQNLIYLQHENILIEIFICSGRLVTNRIKSSTNRLRKMASMEAFPCPDISVSGQSILKGLSCNSLKLELLHYCSASRSFSWFNHLIKTGTFVVVNLLCCLVVLTCCADLLC